MELLIQLKKNANVDSVRQALERYGLWTKSFQNSEGQTSLAVLSYSQDLSTDRILALEGVAQVFEKQTSHPLVNDLAGKTIRIGDLEIGADAPPLLFAGPCSIANKEAIFESAELVAGVGGRVLRGGAFKPRTSPYSFSGHGNDALNWMREAADHFDLKMCTEVMSEHYVDQIAEISDIAQVGSRNMQNFALLRALGATGAIVLLKRGMAATISEWLQAGEHLMAAGAKGIIFCERGILGRDPSTRNLLDLSAVAMLRHIHGLPIVVDPSHALGRRDLIGPMSRAALAAGAHGLMVEAQPADHRALSDAAQSLNPTELIDLARNFELTPSLKAGREVTRL